MPFWMKTETTRVEDGTDPTTPRRRLLRRLAGLTAVLLGGPALTLGLTGGTAAASGAGHLTIYPVGSFTQPHGITPGPDGALWFTNVFNRENTSIERITSAGVVTNFTGTGLDPWDITAGPDGALWFTNYPSSIGRITTAGVVTYYTVSGIGGPTAITVGPDGALWFTNYLDNSIGRITTAGVATKYSDTSIHDPTGIMAGPDGALWFTNSDYPGSIGRITTTGAVTNYTGTGIYDPEGITTGSDGALWFTNYGGSIGRITTAGAVTNYTGTGICAPEGITAGPDGALWFTNTCEFSIGRITTSGVVTRFRGTGISYPLEITAGPDGAIWFTNFGNHTSIGRITTTVTPDITRVTPRSGAVGTTVTITGRNLARAIGVAFHGTPATIVSDTSTKIVVTVPVGATTGHISVTTRAGTATSNGTFRVT
jgi:streptogramin lyase